MHQMACHFHLLHTLGSRKKSAMCCFLQDGNVLDILVQSQRNKQAAKRFFRNLLKGLQYIPRVIVTEKLKSYGAAKREILPGVEHRQHKGLNNRAENSHQPTRLREKNMRKFTSAKQAQRFLSAFGAIADYFQPRRHRLCAREYRSILQGRFLEWKVITAVKLVA
jgi:putative transposase